MVKLFELICDTLYKLKPPWWDPSSIQTFSIEMPPPWLSTAGAIACDDRVDPVDDPPDLVPLKVGEEDVVLVEEGAVLVAQEDLAEDGEGGGKHGRVAPQALGGNSIDI